jgi:hypothetical protein
MTPCGAWPKLTLATCSMNARHQSAGNLQDPGLQGSRTGTGSAWRGHRWQRRGLDGSCRQQPPGKLRCAEVHRP